MDGQTQQVPGFDPNAVSFLVMLCAGLKPLHLSKGRSINLDRVTNYEPVEKLDDKGKPTGAFVPMVFFDGGGEMELSEEENEKFREIWNIYAELANGLFSMAKMFIPQKQPAESQQGE